MRAVLCSVVLTFASAQQAEAGTATATVTGTIAGGYSVKYLNGEETFLRYYDGEPFKIVFQIDYDKPGAQKTIYTLEEDGSYGEMIAGALSGSGSVGEGFEIPVSATFESPYDTFSASGNYLGYALIVGFRGPGQAFSANVADAFEQIEPGYESWKGLSIGVNGFLPDGSALNPLGRLNVPFESDIANSTFSYLYYTHQYYIWDDGYFNDVRLDLNIQRIKYVVNDSVVPEPSTWAMLLFGFGAVGWSLRRPMSSSARHERNS